MGTEVTYTDVKMEITTNTMVESAVEEIIAEAAGIYAQEELDYEELWGDIPFLNNDNNILTVSSS